MVKLIWINNDTTKAFVPQKLYYDLSDAKALIIRSRRTNGYADLYDEGIYLKNERSLLKGISRSNGFNYMCREVIWDDTGVEFFAVRSDSTVDNAYCVPACIWMIY